MTAVTAALGRRAGARREREALQAATTVHDVEGGPEGETSSGSAPAPCWEDAARVQMAMVGMSYRA